MGDFISYQPTLWVIIILIAIFPNTDLLSGIKSGALSKTIGLLILFGTSISGFCYCLNYLFKTPSGAQIIGPGNITKLVSDLLVLKYLKTNLSLLQFLHC